jgi:hypothetical protein
LAVKVAKFFLGIVFVVESDLTAIDQDIFHRKKIYRMTKPLFSAACFCLLMACGGSRRAKTNDNASGKNPELIPACLKEKIKTSSDDPTEGTPLYVAEYQYKDQTVYYVASACCDKFNAVYDSACRLLGYPDGGFTGKGDGKMTDFSAEAKNKKVVWEKAQQRN